MAVLAHGASCSCIWDAWAGIAGRVPESIQDCPACLHVCQQRRRPPYLCMCCVRYTLQGSVHAPALTWGSFKSRNMHISRKLQVCMWMSTAHTITDPQSSRVPAQLPLSLPVHVLIWQSNAQVRRLHASCCSDLCKNFEMLYFFIHGFFYRAI